MTRRAWVAFAASSLIWGVPYLFIKIAVDHGMTPPVLAWGRVTLGALVLLALAWHAGTLPSVRGRWRWLLASTNLSNSAACCLGHERALRLEARVSRSWLQDCRCCWRRLGLACLTGNGSKLVECRFENHRRPADSSSFCARGG